MDLRKISQITDFFLVCSGRSIPHLQTLAEGVEEKLCQQGEEVFHIEGGKNSRWILMDYIDVVVHLFHPEVREFYGLEYLWGDAEQVDPQTL